jgi:RNA recognition motif-containing protein
MRIYVGNLSHQTTEEDLRMVFETYGLIESAKVIKDNYSGQSKGFGFVEMPAKTEAQSAINGMNGRGFKGRTLKVDEARLRSRSLCSRGAREVDGFYWASTHNTSTK